MASARKIRTEAYISKPLISNSARQVAKWTSRWMLSIGQWNGSHESGSFVPIMTSRPPVQPGDIVRIPLPDGYAAYAHALQWPALAFYDVKTREEPQLDELTMKPVLFKICVAADAFRSKRW